MWAAVGDERGSATVLAVVMIAALVTVSAAAVQLGAAVGTRHRAEAAADLAALAAATRAVQGVAAACDSARVVTEGMGTELVRCDLDGWHAVVQVRAQGPVSVLGWGSGHGRARAGPVPP